MKRLDPYFGRYDHAHVAGEVKITANTISKFMKVCHDYTLNGCFWTREIDLKHPRSSNRHPLLFWVSRPPKTMTILTAPAEPKSNNKPLQQIIRRIIADNVIVIVLLLHINFQITTV